MAHYLINFGGLITHVLIANNRRRAVFVKEANHRPIIAVNPADVAQVSNMPAGTVPLNPDPDLVAMLAGRILFSIEGRTFSANTANAAVAIDSTFDTRVPHLQDTLLGNPALHDEIFNNVLHASAHAYLTLSDGSLRANSCFKHAIEFVPATRFGLQCVSSGATYEVTTAGLLRLTDDHDATRFIEFRDGADVLVISHSGGSNHFDHYHLLSKFGVGIATLYERSEICVNCQIQPLGPETTGVIQCTNSQWP